jgi:glycosyltransferase involved in cell wall biosynthesis
VNLQRIDDVIGAGRREQEDRPFTVVSVGRLKGIKDPFTVLSAFHEGAGPASRLRFIGDGALRSELERAAASFGRAEGVSFSGVIPRNDVYRAMLQADLFVSASRGEGLPVAALEAMACRCPVLLSDIAPHREIADGTDAIRLVPTDDADRWSREITRFRAMAPAERAAIGEACRRHVEERFSLTAMHRRYRNVYDQVLRAQALARVGPPHWKSTT